MTDTVSVAARTGQSDDAFLLSWAEGVLRDGLSGSPLLAGRPYEIFGQGSRVNGTAIEQGSDIDLILMLKEPFAGGHGWEGFRDDVLVTLGRTYAVRMGRRCLNVDDADSLFGEMVDVLVATEFRLPVRGGVEQGVFFLDQEGRPIVNFPRQHRRNGDAKDLRTGGRFKEVVRAVKRTKKRLITDGSAPSYLLECLLYNVPDEVYRVSTVEEARRGALRWLSRCELAGLPCQNGINRLFGPGPDQWPPAAAATIIDVLRES